MSKDKKPIEAVAVVETTAPRYVAKVGLNCGVTEENPEGLRIEPGEDVPSWVIEQSGWLIDQGCVEVVNG